MEPAPLTSQAKVTPARVTPDGQKAIVAVALGFTKMMRGRTGSRAASLPTSSAGPGQYGVSIASVTALQVRHNLVRHERLWELKGAARWPPLVINSRGRRALV
jgi:hypothetical protein